MENGRRRPRIKWENTLELAGQERGENKNGKIFRYIEVETKNMTAPPR